MVVKYLLVSNGIPDRVGYPGRWRNTNEGAKRNLLRRHLLELGSAQMQDIYDMNHLKRSSAALQFSLILLPFEFDGSWTMSGNLREDHLGR